MRCNKMVDDSVQVCPVCGSNKFRTAQAKKPVRPPRPHSGMQNNQQGMNNMNMGNGNMNMGMGMGGQQYNNGGYNQQYNNGGYNPNMGMGMNNGNMNMGNQQQTQNVQQQAPQKKEKKRKSFVAKVTESFEENVSQLESK